MTSRGGVFYESHYAEKAVSYARDRRSLVARLTAKDRAKLPAKDFGEPGARKFPMPDASHAANAKARATQAVKAGRMSIATEKKIDAKANRKLGK